MEPSFTISTNASTARSLAGVSTGSRMDMEEQEYGFEECNSIGSVSGSSIGVYVSIRTLISHLSSHISSRGTEASRIFTLGQEERV